MSTTTETTKRRGSPGGNAGIGLPGCSLAGVIVVVPFFSTAAARAMQSTVTVGVMGAMRDDAAGAVEEKAEAGADAEPTVIATTKAASAQ